MPAPAPATIRYIRDEEHYAEVLLRAREAKKTLWIGTADLKDVFTMRRQRSPGFIPPVPLFLHLPTSTELL